MKCLFISAFIFVGLLSAQSFGNSANVAIDVKDVETLNDDLSKYANKKIKVSGEVKDKIDSKSMVIESGGIFNDEIVVIAGPNLKGSIASYKEDADLKITGTLKAANLVDVRREYSWDLDPQVEAELQQTTAFLVADEISMIEK